jgi:hypothetical protein
VEFQSITGEHRREPAAAHVHPNEKDTAVNSDSTAHILTASPGIAFTSGPHHAGCMATFTASATDPYICLIHQVMRGKLTVR